MRFKDQERADFAALAHENPRLHAVLLYMDALAKDRFRCDLTVTSIHRGDNDPYGLHKNWRAADLRIYYRGRDHGPNGTRPPEITRAEMIMLAEDTNRHFDYGLTSRGKRTQTVKVRLASAGHHEDESNDHAHVQVSRKGPWV